MPFAPGIAPDAACFEKTDTASLFVQRTSARGGTLVACVFNCEPRHRIVRSIWDRDDDDDASDWGSHTPDEVFEKEHSSHASRRQPCVKRFEPYTLSFISPEHAFRGLYVAGYGEMSSLYHREDIWCTLECAALDGDEESGASASIRARLRFRLGPSSHEIDECGGNDGETLTVLQLTQVLAPLAWRSCR